MALYAGIPTSYVADLENSRLSEFFYLHRDFALKYLVERNVAKDGIERILSITHPDGKIDTLMHENYSK